MHEAIAIRGYWYRYDYLFEDDDLKQLRDAPEFLKLAEICREREAEAKKHSRPSLNLIRTERSKLDAAEAADGAPWKWRQCGRDQGLLDLLLE